MAGGHGGYQPVKLDPGVEAWSYTRENVWRFFRFTQRTSRQSLLWGALVPLGVFAICQQQDLKWEITAAQRDDPLARWGEHAKRPSERAAAAATAADADEE
ncbi:hypothetical protein JCM8115_006410 [Rhodotorula mucilaginosa]|uniref:NADH dehydrogenase [ubiquinone] 1 beta subcomplex subunit 4 n=1 Tax=Rhodotorula mucilaginosa TaxID=5537 RepID=A0A9P6W451_RHOMI|nr:hypothetical protein C6P46_003691 [Rhodotorula mucilaginosa]TKA57806.1 hypothetical protein B0A53_00955 [Rhodotorula sp. CCFEE 5036]